LNPWSLPFDVTHCAGAPVFWKKNAKGLPIGVKVFVAPIPSTLVSKIELNGVRPPPDGAMFPVVPLDHADYLDNRSKRTQLWHSYWKQCPQQESPVKLAKLYKLACRIAPSMLVTMYPAGAYSKRSL